MTASARVDEYQFTHTATAQRSGIVPRVFRLGLFLLIVSMIVLVVLDRLFHPDAMPVELVSIEGQLKYSSEQDVLRQVQTQIQGNLFALNLAAIEQEVKKFPWIAAVDVRRKWPDEVSLHIVEHTPVARWRNDHWMSASGEVFQLPVEHQDQSGYPLFSGPAGKHQLVYDRYRRWSALLATYGMRIESVNYNQRRQWSLVVASYNKNHRGDINLYNNGKRSSGMIVANDSNVRGIYRFNIVLGRDLLEERLLKFARIFKNGLRMKAGSIQQADLRYNNGFAVQWQSQQESAVDKQCGSGGEICD